MGKAAGTLYLVGTPIGNLEDISARALRILKEVDVLFCEDTRRTLTLLRNFDIKRTVLSFHDHSSPKILKKIHDLFVEGKQVAYVTDGGMPVVSDPGFVLVRAAYNCGATVTTVPGPSAVDVLFALSGLPSPKFLFHGFFPRTKNELEKIIEQIKTLSVVHLFYEAPQRIVACLEVIQRNLPDFQVVLGRELTKIHEEILRGTAKEVFDELSARPKIRGECAVAVMGGTPKPARMAQSTMSAIAQTDRAQRDESQQPSLSDDETLGENFPLTPEQQAEIASQIKSGSSSKDTARELSKKFGVPRRIIYEFIIHRLT